MKDSFVKIGDKVEVILDGAVQNLEIVEVPDVNPALGKISFLSPVTRAILGKKYPSRVVVKAPNGRMIECLLMRPVV